MKRFFLSLVSGDEKGVNSTIVSGMVALLVFCGLSIYAVVKDTSIWNGPAAWMGWGTAVGIVVGIMKGAQTAHARWSSGAQSATVSSPGEVAHVETKP